MNVHDSEKVVGTLTSLGYSRVDRPEEASLVLYNTCSVRDKAEQKVYQRLQQFKRGARGRRFAVLGCVAQQQGRRIFEKAPHVALVCGSASYSQLPVLVSRLESGDQRVTGLEPANGEAFETSFTRRDNPHRAYVTIIEGCDKSCAYCIVPFTRGKERSRASGSILEEVRSLAGSGYTEVQLLGQNVNSYRDPSGECADFAALLASVALISGLRRVRFATSHPRDFSRSIVDVIDAHPVLCDHVHLPVQSGSTAVLERMRRLYTRDDYLRRIEWLKGARRSIALTSDVIVGFPGETEKDFEQTLSLLEEVRFDSLFSFKYSPRPNTSALELDGRVPQEEAGRRLTLLQEKQRAIQIQRNSGLVGTLHEVMVEGFNRPTGQWIGRTSQNRVLNFLAPPGSGSLAGRYVEVRVTRAGPNSLAGESVEQARICSNGLGGS
ncbi:MAG: tRNA (N6-isopentenyl adenosine(37)-C2)-methylthiotransferase MiaB [Bryobacterales bacterium]|nr:tRNA (N6-isopentenyl adenosine(37)-C2)-methylthiotransferase MiaB [Bryobacterales bacterium]